MSPLKSTSPMSSSNLSSSICSPIINELNDALIEDYTENDEDTFLGSNSSNSRKKLFETKVSQGYHPIKNNFCTRFSFQTHELHAERMIFVIEEEKFYSKICCSKPFFFNSNNETDQVNKTCSDLPFNSFLQG